MQAGLVGASQIRVEWCLATIGATTLMFIPIKVISPVEQAVELRHKLNTIYNLALDRCVFTRIGTYDRYFKKFCSFFNSYDRVFFLPFFHTIAVFSPFFSYNMVFFPSISD